MEKKVFKIFISSTFTDLKDIRTEVISGVLKAGHLPIMMESFPATATQKEMITNKISSCDAYFVIIGSKYGSIDPDTKLSYTEWEYDYAKESGLPIYTMIMTEDFISSRFQNGKIKLEDIETSKPEYIALVEKTKLRLADFVDGFEQIKSMSEAGILQIVRDYSDVMIGLVSGNILEDLSIAENEIEKLRQGRSKLQVQLTEAQHQKTSVISLPENKEFDDLLNEKFQSKSTDTVLEDGIVYIKNFVEAKVNQLKQKIDNHRGKIYLGYDSRKKDEVLFGMDPDCIFYLANYEEGVINIKVKINEPFSFESIDKMNIVNDTLKSEKFDEKLSVEYLNRILELYYKIKGNE